MREPVCPAASTVRGDSVVCGVLALGNESASLRGSREAGQVSPVMDAARHGSVVRHQCFGRGVPGSESSYCRCVLWRAQRDAEIAGRHGDGALRDEQAHRPPERGRMLSEAMAELRASEAA
jgi:hypothetical protein